MVDINKAYWGNQNVKHIYFGGDHVKRIYKGNELIYLYGWNPVTFNPSGSLQTFTVPAGTRKIHVDCVASRGVVGAGDRIDSVPGYGGRVQCDVSVSGGQVLYITVGAIPQNWTTASYNASDIRIGGTSYNNRIIVAGGGGSARHTSNRHYTGNGGNGGGLVGAPGTTNRTTRAYPGQGGTQTAGGAGGSGRTVWGQNGSFGIGGSNTSGGGAGGAGWYGGGAGGYGAHDDTWGHAGGGGGSSYTNGNYCTNVVHTQGYRNGAGYVTISYIEV